MDITQFRSQLKQYMDQLSPEKLILVADFCQDLEAEENLDATEELLSIEGFESAFEKANQEVKKGKVKNWREIKKDV